MLLTTGIVALSRKVADERTKRREARQGVLEVGNGDIAKRAFTSQISRRGTEIKYEDPSDIAAETQNSSPPSEPPSKPALISESSQPFEADVKSPTETEVEMACSTTTSPYDESQATSLDLSRPPPYSPGQQLTSAPALSSTNSRDTDGHTLSPSDTQSLSTRSTNSNGTHAIRIKTVGADLKSGFPYHPALFELRVHPEKWTTFTNQIIESTKFSMNDHAKIWAAATATAMTGAIGTSIMLGRGLTRTTVEQKVKDGLANTSSNAGDDGGLGDVLRSWNESYFNERGLFVHLELSESAMKNPGQKSKFFRKGAFLYSSREDRDRKKDERKFVVVVTRLDGNGMPSEAVDELSLADGKDMPAELAGEDGVGSGIPELPVEKDPVELPVEATAKLRDEKAIYPPSGYVEMDSDNTLLLQRMSLEQAPERKPIELEGGLAPEALDISQRPANG